MGFYESISRFYDDIFPVGMEQVEFLKEAAPDKGARILDVACGSGGYAVALAKAGYKVTALDLYEDMVSLAKEKALLAGQNIDAIKADMRELKKNVPNDNKPFGLVFCIGNSLVHLGSLGEIKAAVTEMYSMLEAGGVLVVQTINYDRILKYGLSELPTIINKEKGLEFVRKYHFDKENAIVHFNTVLSVVEETGSKVYENSIELLTMYKSDMLEIISNMGFNKIELFGDFSKTPYTEDSYLLVLKAVK